jgi:hypothetical protein
MVAFRKYLVLLAEFGGKGDRQENKLDPRNDPRDQAFDYKTMKKVSFEFLGNFIPVQK